VTYNGHDTAAGPVKKARTISGGLHSPAFCFGYGSELDQKGTFLSVPYVFLYGMDSNPPPRAHRPGAATHEPALHTTRPACGPDGAGAPSLPVDAAGDLLDFEPVPTRPRHDGWTPQKQREFVEALADSGVVRHAAGRVGMTEQSVNRLRRRSDARSFDLACEAAQRFGARRLLSVAWERAIEGTPRRHYWRGELVGEDRVYDNRLLIHLLGRVQAQLEPSPQAAKVAEHWDEAMDAIEQGTPFSQVEALAPRDCVEEDLMRPDENDLWQEVDGEWWTRFPPPEGFDGIEDGALGDDDYRRTLSPDEEARVEREIVEQSMDRVALECRRRDCIFGFAGGIAGEANSRRSVAEPSEPSEPPGTAFRAPGGMP